MGADGPGWQGRLELEFVARAGGTRLGRSFVQAPMKVQRPFFPEGDRVCHVVTLHTAGGVVGGDRLSTQVHLAQNAHALTTTATAGKIYRSNGQVAEQMTHLRVAAGGCLEWLPQETIVFDGADYRQRLRVDLDEDALWLGWEITRLGRTARGEGFASGQWRSHTEVWQDGTLLWVDPQQILGGAAPLSSPPRAERLPPSSPVSLSLASQSPNFSADLLPQTCQFIPTVASSSPLPSLQYAATRLQSGLLYRYRGHSTLEVRRWFIQIWHLLRPALVNRPGYLPRVW
ncbi:urease accessory protein UreD [Leptolyngbya sp. O-77]|uniref:urease accessory protein UreD n=1 Tax=Leptolyngbya sp. O-77 TaxID=1080068 RepID=UPI00074D2A73|nr:urease accessory protein UreD [Leptolyngbya sp. O-77]BAU41568.1 Urease accessory protein UreD [Leptolyngbya sp. O-77]